MTTLRSKPSHVTLRANGKRPHSLLCMIRKYAAQTGQLASAVVSVTVTDMRSRPPRIPTSYHLSACLAARSEVGKKHLLIKLLIT
ncbi:hypothetical protein AVEN_131023-1 [Araneus ventricosus]|uniref:Uncharacterized protein n=1 Tax=Araneus ventricosus TaxID=182803 RepID=A0A4Y2PZ05_ARAVE|nr:hypothetical protein AVEN_131023-1 [Araneus ventricosus]